MTGTGPGHGVSGLINAVADSNPAVAYPPDTIGFTPLNEGFAGIILAAPSGGSPVLQMYCIDILTPTSTGYGYNLGTWDEANVTNVGFVARLLNTYYPSNPAAPAIGVNGINNTADQAAAVQAAIWYFSDNYVLASGDPLLAAVTEIVNTVRLLPPLPAPAPPSLQITAPATTSGPAGTVIGPYVVVTDDPDGAVVAATGAEMFSDAAATAPIANGTSVPNGQPIWLRSTTIGAATLIAHAEALVPSGNAYLYSGNMIADDAQTLILAQSTEVQANASAEAEFLQETTTTTTSTTTTTTTTTTLPTTTTTEATTTTSSSTTTTSSSTTTTSSSTTTTTVASGTTTTSLAPTTTIDPNGVLPQTGTDTVDGVAVAVVVVLGGMALVLLGRRRFDSTH
ncbi:MAG: Cys-Gln thioester bond-forming surface protein [Ilumatobacteraceae bacterium]